MGIEGSSSDAEMVGTTRSRVSFFMNRFRNLGFTTPASTDHELREPVRVPA